MKIAPIPPHPNTVPLSMGPIPVGRLELRGRLLDLCLALASSDVERSAQRIYRTALNTAACVYGQTAEELEAILHPAPGPVACGDQTGGL